MDSLATADQLILFADEEVPPDAAELHVRSASGLVRSFCKWRLDYSGDEGEDLVNDGTAQQLLLLQTLKVINVLKVTVDGVELPETGYEWSVSGILTRSCGWWAKRRGVVSTVVHGYEDFPAEITSVVLGVALRMFLNPSGFKYTSLEGYNPGYSDGVGLLDGEKDILSRHRLA